MWKISNPLRPSTKTAQFSEEISLKHTQKSQPTDEGFVHIAIDSRQSKDPSSRITDTETPLSQRIFQHFTQEYEKNAKDKALSFVIREYNWCRIAPDGAATPRAIAELNQLIEKGRFRIEKQTFSTQLSENTAFPTLNKPIKKSSNGHCLVQRTIMTCLLQGLATQSSDRLAEYVTLEFSEQLNEGQILEVSSKVEDLLIEDNRDGFTALRFSIALIPAIREIDGSLTTEPIAQKRKLQFNCSIGFAPSTNTPSGIDFKAKCDIRVAVKENIPSSPLYKADSEENLTREMASKVSGVTSQLFPL